MKKILMILGGLLFGWLVFVGIYYVTVYRPAHPNSVVGQGASQPVSTPTVDPIDAQAVVACQAFHAWVAAGGPNAGQDVVDGVVVLRPPARQAVSAAYGALRTSLSLYRFKVQHSVVTTSSDQESRYGLLDVMANGMHDVVWQGSPSGSYAGHPGNPIWQGDIPNVNYICGKVGE